MKQECACEDRCILGQRRSILQVKREVKGYYKQLYANEFSYTDETDKSSEKHNLSKLTQEETECIEIE